MDPSKWIDVTPEKFNYHLDHFVIPSHYEKDVSSILIPHGVIMVCSGWATIANLKLAISVK